MVLERVRLPLLALKLIIMEKDSAQINIIDEHYSLYISSDIKGDAFLSITHDVLSKSITDAGLLTAMLFREVSKIIDEDELNLANLTITNSYNLFCNMTITVDLQHGFVQLDGGDVEDKPQLKRYNSYKMSIDYFLNDFFSTASF